MYAEVQRTVPREEGQMCLLCETCLEELSTEYQSVQNYLVECL